MRITMKSRESIPNQSILLRYFISAVSVQVVLQLIYIDFRISSTLTHNIFHSAPDETSANHTSLRDVSGQVGVSHHDTGAIPTIEALASTTTFSSTLGNLYMKYGKEIADYRPIMRKWCEETKSCKFGDYEVEMLYMLVREHKPQNVFEMAPNRGYSSHWILHALHLNDATSKLHSFDIHDTSTKFMSPDYQARWVFTLGDYSELYDEGKLEMDGYDFLFVDALHEPEFARGYCQRLFANHIRPNTVVAIHDIVADSSGRGRESEEVYKYLAMANNARNVFTYSRFAMPNSLYAPQTDIVLPKINKIRSDLGIIPDCGTPENCAKHDQGFMYFENNDAPTIFFTLN
ncbi:unnamed protein product [Pseudo-nitzschia multistriata]|uniref:Class I SAM-dependent methyltransferase n=1 Tax=Pseudo-nitzschia multistriata TaxID=183589 RepID=A0A448ZN59_9STRA|nr:unnamed protein product [Pseudo-nitzschia multistriata]